MKNYLYVMVETTPLLLDGNSVLEILPLIECGLQKSDQYSFASGHIDWRGKLLPVINVHHLLEIPLERIGFDNVGVVYRLGHDQPPVVLVVDEIIRFLKIERDSFVSLPLITKKLSNMFDKVYIDSDEDRQVYCIRSPFPKNVLDFRV